ncbi:DUF4765 family protein [Streptomyces sp. NPDC058086]|uniref:eCIS core domain-containing protein n=1 Tax=Streptomyces sp. NPDC058086 TaxID=3346334 RepID=UPI0036EF2461
MRAQESEVGRAGDQDKVRRSAAVNTPAHQLLSLQRMAGNAAVARAVAEEQHAHDANCGHGPSVQRSAVHQVLRSPGRPLDAPLQTEMEARFGEGADFSGVRVHTDAVAQRSAAEIGAKAYTSGSNVVWDGQDKHVLAHELDHYRQQLAGPVPGTDNGSGVKVSDPNDWAERAAEETSRRVMSGAVPTQRAVDPGARTETAAPAGAPAVQRMTDPVVQRVHTELATTATTRTESDSEYSSEDDLTAKEAQLPPPTSDSSVEHAVESGSHTTVVLYRGEMMGNIRAMVESRSAGGAAPSANTPAPTEEQAAAQVSRGRLHPEFTADRYISRQFSRQGPRGVIVVRINTKYLTRGSESEAGWVALSSAPVEIVAVVDRSAGKSTSTSHGVNAS